jgi:hypothetical protein
MTAAHITFTARLAVAALFIAASSGARASDDCQKQLEAAILKITTSGPVRMQQNLPDTGFTTQSDFVAPNRVSDAFNSAAAPTEFKVQSVRIGSDMYQPGGRKDKAMGPSTGPVYEWHLAFQQYANPRAFYATSCAASTFDFEIGPSLGFTSIEDFAERNAKRLEMRAMTGKKGGLMFPPQLGHMAADPATGRPVAMEIYAIPAAGDTSGKKHIQTRVAFAYDPAIKIEPPK